MFGFNKHTVCTDMYSTFVFSPIIMGRLQATSSQIKLAHVAFHQFSNELLITKLLKLWPKTVHQTLYMVSGCKTRSPSRITPPLAKENHWRHR